MNRWLAILTIRIAHRGRDAKKSFHLSSTENRRNGH